MKRFYEIRKAALEKWAQNTGRKIVDDFSELNSDNYQGAYECNWQNDSPCHVNLFCSLGDWACNVTDLLKDDRFDKLYFENVDEAAVLFRHYTRIMLVVSELLTDFQDIYLHSENLIEGRKTNKDHTSLARRFYFPSYLGQKDTITLILDYINSVCKHKTQNLHICNNHCAVHFADNGMASEGYNYITINDSRASKGKNAILVPELSFLIDSLLNCYAILDSYFREHNNKYLRLCRKFSSNSPHINPNSN